MKDLPEIYGFNKTSEAGKEVFAYSIFLKGCNFRCPYCMNSRLVNGNISKIIPINEIKKSVKENDIEWVMISGGEPTFTKPSLLINLIEEIKSWGCKVGMSTNGSMPDILKDVIKSLNFVAMDIKSASYLDYQDISNVDAKYLVHKSKLLLESHRAKTPGFDYEIRTVLYPPYFENMNDDMYRIGAIILRGDRWVLQQFRHSKNMLSSSSSRIKPFSEEKLKEILKEAQKYCDNVSIRYV